MSTKSLYETYIRDYRDRQETASYNDRDFNEEFLEYDEFCNEYWERNRDT